MAKQLFSLLLIFQVTFLGHAQRTEFKINENGLIYDVPTMDKLKHIVDSLNLKFRVCEPKAFLAKTQAIAHSVTIEETNVKEALNDLNANIPFDDFIKKYPHATIKKNRCVVTEHYEDYEGKTILEFSEMNMSNGNGLEIRFEEDAKKYQKILRGQWVYNYFPKTEYSKENIDAFYFTEDMKAVPLTEKYTRMVQYSDCMVDTNSQIFFESARNNIYSVRSESKDGKKIERFLNMVNDFPNRPNYKNYKKTKKTKDDDEIDYEKFAEDSKNWDSLRTIYVEKLSKTDKFKRVLEEAVNEAIKDTIGNSEFETYVMKYYSKEKALFLKRSRVVVGGCSQDQSPRFHAQDIAILAAETANWEVFLRAHLDIMNDRFQRVSDGSYAWAGRQTYIGELEELGINVPDLLLGISLRVENAAQNHYFGSIGRLGRALAETKYQDEIEQKMLSIIEDKQLDNYNRLLMYFLFRNYNYNLSDVNHKKENVVKLKNAIQSMPYDWASEADFKED